MNPLPGDLAFALSRHQAGECVEAEAVYRRILAADPRHADALHLLGVLNYQRGHHDRAIDGIGARKGVRTICLGQKRGQNYLFGVNK